MQVDGGITPIDDTPDPHNSQSLHTGGLRTLRSEEVPSGVGSVWPWRHGSTLTSVIIPTRDLGACVLLFGVGIAMR